MAKAEGLAKTDYDVIVVGATAARLAGLRSGAVAASLLLPPVLFEAEDAGFVNLGLVYPYTKDLPFAGFEVNRAWAMAHLELAKRMLAAFDQGVAWFYDDKNRDEAISILAERRQDEARGRGQDLRPIPQDKLLRALSHHIAHAPRQSHEGGNGDRRSRPHRARRPPHHAGAREAWELAAAPAPRWRR